MKSIILDKSVFHRIAEQPSETRIRIWNHLHRLGQIIVPPILIEEVIVNAGAPGPIPSDVIREMVATLLRLRPCWIDDPFETAYAELVHERPTTSFVPFPASFAEQVATLQFDDPGIVEWLNARKAERLETANIRIAGQASLFPPDQVENEAGFWAYLRAKFMSFMRQDTARTELIETILGDAFRQRHPGSGPAIDRGLARFTASTFANYRVALSIIVTRLAYMYGPTVPIRRGNSRSAVPFLRSGLSAQVNNVMDEQYVVPAMLCHLALTRDVEMHRVLTVFASNGFNQCEVPPLDPSGPIDQQLLAIPIV